LARKYEKKARAASTDETRSRILRATLALHSDKGFAATSWQDIADRAGVAVGTVYYHFPTIDDLVPACGALARTQSPPPAPGLLDGVRGLRARIDVLVRALVRYYTGNPGSMRNALRERHKIEIVDAVMSESERTISRLVRELDPSISPEVAKKVEALVDFRTWDSFNSRGITEEVIVQTVSSLVRALVRNAHR
jgi:AcrR family transcriptional regulator